MPAKPQTLFRHYIVFNTRQISGIIQPKVITQTSNPTNQRHGDNFEYNGFNFNIKQYRPEILALERLPAGRLTRGVADFGPRLLRTLHHQWLVYEGFQRWCTLRGPLAFGFELAVAETLTGIVYNEGGCNAEAGGGGGSNIYNIYNN